MKNYKPIAIYFGENYTLKIIDTNKTCLFVNDEESPKVYRRKIYGNYFLYKNNDSIKISDFIYTF